MRSLISCCSLMACLAASGTVAADDGPSADIPELKALDHYRGTWDVEITAKGQPFTKGKATAGWILDGRYLQQVGELQADDGTPVVKFTSLMTYDPAAKVYRTWIFLSDGGAGESEGTWNASAKTMKAIGKKDPAGGFSTTTADFQEADTERWSIVYTDASGQRVTTMVGTNTRRKD